MNIKVETFLTCEYMKLVGGQYFIIGGGVNGASSSAYPADVSFAIATRLAIYGLTKERSVGFDVVVENELGENVLATPFQPTLEFEPDDEGFESVERMNLPLFFPVLRLQAPGDYRVVLLRDGDELASTSLRFSPESREQLL